MATLDAQEEKDGEKTGKKSQFKIIIKRKKTENYPTLGLT